MAQMPIQMAAGRAQAYAPPPLPPKAAAGPAAQPPQALDPGAISGGKLRPGAIDQMSFRQRMEKLNRADPNLAAGAPPPANPAPAAPAPRSLTGIPVLTPAQLAALGVDVSNLPPPPAATPEVAAAPESAPAPQAGAPETPAPDAAAAPTATSPSEATPADPAIEPDPAVQQASAPDQPAAAVAEEDAPQGPMPGAHLGRDGVWELPRQPGKDERAWLQGMNAKWRIVENPDSVKLFLGEDGKFGLDDLVDLINPLQHIPFVNIAYRALTGDEASGLAQLAGAIPFGPLSVASSVTDLAFRAQTGAGMAENGLAMLFGPEEGDISTAAGQMPQVAEIRRGSNR